MLGGCSEFLSNNKITADVFKIKQILTAVKTAVGYDDELLEVISFLYFLYERNHCSELVGIAVKKLVVDRYAVFVHHQPKNNLNFIDLMIFADAEVFVVRYAATLEGIGGYVVKGCRYLSLGFLLDFSVQMPHDGGLIFLEKIQNFI